MKPVLIFICAIAVVKISFAQQIALPLERNNFQKVTSYDELTAFINQLDQQSGLLNVETIGRTVQGRNLYALRFSSGEFGKDKSKLKVLFLAQQHGNEQSGKEGALMLALALLKPENKYLFDKMDVAIIPQMNPDGSEVNKRRNGNDADLNRNHLVLTEPETQALHRFFDKYLFEVTMDVHEYAPYGGEWQKYGYRRNASETLGVNTNPNVSEQIRNFSNQEVFPYWSKYVTDSHFTTAIYAPGGPPEQDYIRHSTFDVNDGRQSFGIQNSLSFIQEGLNGKDNFVENIRHRAEGQMTGMRAILEFSYLHKDKIKKMVTEGRKALSTGKANPQVSIQSEHVANGQKLTLTLLSYATNTDTLVVVNDYRPVVKSVHDVAKPAGYLVPVQNKELMDWVQRQALVYTPFKNQKGFSIEQYTVNGIDSIDFEREIIINPRVEAKVYTGKIAEGDYVYIPAAQLKGNMLVLALEPKSELGLVTYRQFADLLKTGETFPVLRVIKK